MGIEQIRKNAPKDATFYFKDQGFVEYACKRGDDYFLWYRNKWRLIQGFVLSAYLDKMKSLY